MIANQQSLDNAIIIDEWRSWKCYKNQKKNSNAFHWHYFIGIISNYQNDSCIQTGFPTEQMQCGYTVKMPIWYADIMQKVHTFLMIDYRDKNGSMECTLWRIVQNFTHIHKIYYKNVPLNFFSFLHELISIIN